MNSSPLSRFSMTLFAAALCIGLFAFLSGKASLWSPNGVMLFGSSGPLLGAALLLAIASLVMGFKRGDIELLPIAPFAAGLAAVFISDWLCRSYNLLQGPSIRGEILLGGILSYLCLRTGRPQILALAGVLLPIVLFSVFLVASRGRILFSDDHPVFLYRLILLKDQFPFIPFYNALWNGGVDARDFFATGALNVFFLLAPMVYLTNLLSSYSVLVGVILFVLFPAAVLAAARLERLTPLASTFAVVLALTNSLLWYRWALKYGTLGFICAAMLVPLVISLSSRMLSAPREFTRRQAWLWIAATTLMLFWSLTALIIIPLGLLALFSLRALLVAPVTRRAILWLLVINIPWILVFLSVSKVFTFVGNETERERRVLHAAHQEIAAPESGSSVIETRLRRAVRIIRESAVSTHPLLIFFALPGLARMRRGSRRGFAVTALWLVFVGSIGATLKPQLELDRMLVVLGLIMTLPAASALDEFFMLALHHRGWRMTLAGLSGGFLLAAPFSSSAVLLNRSIEQYYFADGPVYNLAEAIKTHGGEGRTFFSGFILHHLNGGHIAPLVFMTGKPLIASSFAHDKWRYTDALPEEFRQEGDAGIDRYFDLMNVTAVVAHERDWFRYFLARPDAFERVWDERDFHLFKRVRPTPGYFLEGEGSILAQPLGTVRAEIRSAEAVIKFNYFPFLRSDTCRLDPFPVSPAITFIRLSQCSKPVTTIRAAPAWDRLGE